jgi:xanthine dehydrogenase accessory factor
LVAELTGTDSIAGVAAAWLDDDRRVVASTLVRAEGSAPLEVGATMLVDDRGQVEGSITGGCVESAVVEESNAVFAGGSARLRTYGISDSTAAGVGLMCGGTVHIFVRELSPDDAALFDNVARAVSDGRPVAVATMMSGPHAGRALGIVNDEQIGSLGGGEHLDRAARRDAEGCLAHGTSMLRVYGAKGETMGSEVEVFIQATSTPANMIIFGAIDFSAALAPIAKRLGYQVHICDAREPFLRGSRYSVADHLAAEWPDRYLESLELDERDVILVFTHDPKFDEPALISALQTGAGYIGALGSRNTHQDRRRRLLDAGVAAEDIDRIAAPCGLDIGARTPDETAISVLAEVIARSTGRRGGPLAQASGRIHSPRSVPAHHL